MQDKKERRAISVLRSENFPEWYQEVIKAADLSEHSSVRGCMVIKPWGQALWENIQQTLDKKIKDLGHENAYFPLFIPLSFLEKEATHVEGFAKECAIVTHHRLTQKDGKLVPDGELEMPLVVRPTSETIIGDSFSRWIKSYRDLPLLINQWANVVRWEMRPRPFLRSLEFLWQEGHTAHRTEKEAMEETLTMLEAYRQVVEDYLGIPVVIGEKSKGERFPGAVKTFTLEAIMQDGKALQCCTSHYLGQNFAKAQNIQYQNESGEMEFVYTTSWGLTTRLIGALVMVHGDDDGLRLPPNVAPKQVVIIPILNQEDKKDQVLTYAEELRSRLGKLSYAGAPLRVQVDRRDWMNSSEKNWFWIKKGVPLRIEVGPKDLEKGQIVLSRRDQGHKAKAFLAEHDALQMIEGLLCDIQKNLYAEAKTKHEKSIDGGCKTLEEVKHFYSEQQRGLVECFWNEEYPQFEEWTKEQGLSIRCLPLKGQLSKEELKKHQCIYSGTTPTTKIVIGRSY